MGRRGRELTPQLRSRLCELKKVGFSYPKIHELHLEVPSSTIRSTTLREVSRDDNQSKHRSSAPRKLTQEQRDHLYDLAVNKDPHITIADLSKEVGGAVKKRTKEMGGRKWKKRPQSEIEAAQRLQSAGQSPKTDRQENRSTEESTLE